jgi:BirA family biotin operon repressor/biotin-[acetyl-CoA-carboxylase] ligase
MFTMSCSKSSHEMLNYNSIVKAISPENLSRLNAIDIFEIINSTNTWLLQGVKSGMASATFCFAEQQTQGRGRHGKVWFSPFGQNIYCSLLWHFTLSDVDLSALSLAVGVMVVAALAKYGVADALQLKWPNDIYFNGRKLGGILLESLPLADAKIAVVMGIGLNVDFGDAQVSPDWIALREITGEPQERNLLAGLLANELLAQLPRYVEQGFAGFSTEWRKLDMLMGQNVTIASDGQETIGTVQDITARGELIVKNSSGERSYAWGEVTVRALR